MSYVKSLEALLLYSAIKLQDVFVTRACFFSQSGEKSEKSMAFLLRAFSFKHLGMDDNGINEHCM